MNAVRFGPDFLREWYANGSDESLSSYCLTECDFRDQCHADFGHDENRGLYPLTSDAVLNIAERAGAIGERANPRALLRALSQVLDQSARDLDENRFPARHLFDSIRTGSALGAVHPIGIGQIFLISVFILNGVGDHQVTDIQFRLDGTGITHAD